MTYIIDLHRLWEGTQFPTKKRRKNELTGSLAHLISAIVVAKGDIDALIKTLHSLFEQKFIREVIVIHGAGSSALEKRLEQFAQLYPRCFIVPHEQEMSLSQAYNLGARYASAQYLLFVDPTYTLPSNALSRMLLTGISKPHPWIVGIQHSRQSRHLFRKMTRFYTRDYDPTEKLPEVSLSGGGIHVSNISSKCMLMPTRTFLELKGIDPNCSPDMLAVDLCLRTHLAGGAVYSVRDLEFNPKAEKPISFVERLKSEWQTFRGRCYFYRKYVSKKTNVFLRTSYLGLLGCQFLGNCLYCMILQLLPQARKEAL